MSNVSNYSARGPGRPREYDIEDAVDRAIQVFSERGFHATSIGDLAAAMELSQGSIYKAFKDKRAVFLASVDRYVAMRAVKLAEATRSAKTGLDRIRKMLAFYVDSAHGAEGMQGCLIVGSAAELATFDEEIAQKITEVLDKNETLIAEFIKQGQQDGSIPSRIDRTATARFLLCLLQGMRVVGKTGRTREEMAVVMEIAMRTVR